MQLVYYIKLAVGLLTDLFIWPFRFSPWLALCSASLCMALIALAGFKLFSNQEKLKRKKARVLARVLELHLYRHDITGIFSAFGRVFTAVTAYTWETLKPMLVILIPMILVIVRCAGWFEYQGAPLHEKTIIQATFSQKHPDVLMLEYDRPGLAVDDEPFVNVARTDWLWQLTPSLSFDTVLHLFSASLDIEKTFAAGPELQLISPVRSGRNWTDFLLYSQEPPIDADKQLLSVRIDYPHRSFSAAGIEIHWIISLLVISMIFGYALKRPFNVDF